MLCETPVRADTGLGLGCNISVTLSNSGELYMGAAASPKKSSFLDNLLRKSSEKVSSPKSPKRSLFNKKAPAKVDPQQAYDEEMALFVQELMLEGRTEEEINLHLSHIIEARSPAVQSAPPSPLKSPKSGNIVTRFIRDVKLAWKDEPVYYIEEPDMRGLTVRISSAPFYGALPPAADISFEELAKMEPVYDCNKCINNLPSCKHDGTPLPGDQTNCSVCLDEFCKGEQLKSLPCVHFFHKDCIDAWLMVGHTCPVCKYLVV